MLKAALRINNTDPRWYRDKYLIVICTVGIIGVLSSFQGWPPRHDELSTATKWLAVSALCVVLTPNRMLLLLECIAFVAVRGVIGFFLYGSVAALMLGLAASAILFVLLSFTNPKAVYSKAGYQIREYTYAELMIDTFALLSLLWLYVKFA